MFFLLLGDLCSEVSIILESNVLSVDEKKKRKGGGIWGGFSVHASIMRVFDYLLVKGGAEH